MSAEVQLVKIVDEQFDLITLDLTELRNEIADVRMQNAEIVKALNLHGENEAFTTAILGILLIGFFILLGMKIVRG